MISFWFFISFLMAFCKLNKIFFLKRYFQILSLHEIFLCSIYIHIIILNSISILSRLWINIKTFFLLFLNLWNDSVHFISTLLSFLIRFQTCIHAAIQIFQIVNILLIFFHLGIEIEIHNIRIRVFWLLNDSLIEQKWVIIIIFNRWWFCFQILRIYNADVNKILILL